METRKRTLFVGILFFAIVSINAQSLNSIFSKYSKHDDCELISINKPMLTLARTLADKESKEILAKISGMKILTSDNSKLSKSLMGDVQSLVKREKFEPIVEVRDKGERIMIYLKESAKNKTDILILTNENLVWFQGKLSLSDIENLRTINL